jgi:hypothetical protein
MRSITSRLALILTGAILLAMMAILATSRPEYCGPIDIPPPHAEAATSASACTPTLAPRQSLVVVQVESDKPDIQVTWAEN